MDEFLADMDDPVFVNTSVTYRIIIELPERKHSASDVNEMKNALLACFVQKSFKANFELAAASASSSTFSAFPFST